MVNDGWCYISCSWRTHALSSVEFELVWKITRDVHIKREHGEIYILFVSMLLLLFC